MKAIQVNAYGEPTDLQVVEVNLPEPEPHEVLIKVEAAGINYADIMQCRGLYLGGPTPPFILGFEAAGVVEKLGGEVTGFQAGQRVAAITNGSTYAEFVTANEASLIPMPDTATFEQGAAFPVVFMTAYHALHTCARLQSGESVLIHAAAGGVGTAAIQLAKAAGATVYATASNAEKLDFVQELGADVCINYRDEDFEGMIQDRTDGKGVDVVLESVGGEVFSKSQSCLAHWGRLVVLGVASSQPGTVDAVDLLFHNKRVVGLHLGHLAATRPDLMKVAATQLVQDWYTGKLKPIVGKSFPLKHAIDALQWIIQRRSVGKVVLLPNV